MASANGDARDPRDAPGGWVLVVDDDADIREALVDVLGDAGYPVRVAASGIEALEVLAGSPPPALILLDLMMPGMDGFGFRAAQAADARLASVPVVIISAGGNVAADAKRLGVTSYIQKPMKPDVVLREVRALCGAAGAAPSARAPLAPSGRATSAPR
jgi:CheY-like chemotaxis protein